MGILQQMLGEEGKSEVWEGSIWEGEGERSPDMLPIFPGPPPLPPHPALAACFTSPRNPCRWCQCCCS